MTPTAQINVVKSVLDSVYTDAAILITSGKIPEHWGSVQIVWLLVRLMEPVTPRGGKFRKARLAFCNHMLKIENENKMTAVEKMVKYLVGLETSPDFLPWDNKDHAYRNLLCNFDCHPDEAREAVKIANVSVKEDDDA